MVVAASGASAASAASGSGHPISGSREKEAGSRGRPIDPELKARTPDLQWSAIAGAGNIYRHNYDLVEERYVWRTATLELPKLLAAVDSELGR